MKYKIEKNVEIQSKLEMTEMGQVIKQMKPGDSIFVLTHAERNKFANICAKLNYSYTTRKLTENNASNLEIDYIPLTGYRCWIKNGQNLEEQRKKKH